jgi:Tfp pilus assembly protein PilF
MRAFPMLIKAISALLFAVVLPQMQPGQTGRIRVAIPVLDGKSVGTVQVILRNENGWMAVPVEQTGKWEPVEFTALAVGSYEVLVNVDGYEPMRWPVALGDMSRIVVVNVPLKEIAGYAVPRKAIQDYEKAVEENRKGNTDRALKLLTSIVQTAPDFYSAHNTLGTVYQKMNRYREAEAEYRRAGELSPRSDVPLVNLGNLYVQEADARATEDASAVPRILNDARTAIEKALKLQPSAMGHYLLGTVQYRSTAFEDSETNLRRALELEPRMPAARLMLANLYMRQQKWGDALAEFDAYLSENPKAANRTQIQETRAKVVQRIK